MPSMFRKQASHGLWGSAGLKMPIHVHFSADNFDPKISQTGLVFGVQSWGLWVQDYKSLRAAGTICVTLANTETHRQTDRQTDIILTSLYEQLIQNAKMSIVVLIRGLWNKKLSCRSETARRSIQFRNIVIQKNTETPLVTLQMYMMSLHIYC